MRPQLAKSLAAERPDVGAFSNGECSNVALKIASVLKIKTAQQCIQEEQHHDTSCAADLRVMQSHTHTQ